MPQYKLSYFDLRGRGEPIRLLFVTAGVAFEDHRFSNEEWTKLKPNTRWGTVPVLYVDGKPLGQTLSILRFLAAEFNLDGKTSWENARMNEIVDVLSSELAKKWADFTFYEKDEEKKKEAKKNFLDEFCPKILGWLNQMQGENGGDFFVGKTLSWVDIFFADLMQTIGKTVGKDDLLNNFENLVKLSKAVFATQNIKDYIEKRPESSM